MKHHRLLPLIAFCAVFAWAADVAGTWKGEMHSAEGGAFPVTLTLIMEGDNLTGKLTQGEKGSPREIETPKKDGDQISFSMSYHTPAGDSRKVNFTATVDGNQLKLISQREGSQRKQSTTLERQ